MRVVQAVAKLVEVAAEVVELLSRNPCRAAWDACRVPRSSRPTEAERKLRPTSQFRDVGQTLPRHPSISPHPAGSIRHRGRFKRRERHAI